MIPKNKDPLVEHNWISKEFADDYAVEYDILRKDTYRVHVIDNNDLQEKLDNPPTWWKRMREDRRRRQNEYCRKIFSE